MRTSISVLFLIILMVGATSADIPKSISYQGKVTLTSGNPVVDGNYVMRFRIYNAASGGSLLWDSGNQWVTLTGGIFDVILGDNIPPAITLDFNQDYWLQVTFSGTNVTPRQRLTSVGYAYMASGLVPGTEVSGAVTSGTTAALKATNTAGSGYTRGLHGESASTSGFGVYGTATASSGFTYGGLFETTSTSGRAIGAQAYASTGDTYGVYALVTSLTGTAIYGCALSSYGYGYGVYGENSSTDGGYGVYYVGNLAGSGTKSCVVKTTQGPTLLYCQESPENWFEDAGEGMMLNGRAHVDLDRLFLETVTIDTQNPMKVFVQLNGDCAGVYVVKGSSGFDVVELQGGSSSVAFDYRVMAKRKGFESKRLDYCKAAETDSYLYPELREREIQELRRVRSRTE
jgi:hypothetical protein